MDPIANLLTSIRNGIASGCDSISVADSKIKVAICAILRSKGVISNFEIKEEAGKKFLHIDICSVSKKFHLKRISKPSRKVYIKSKNLKSPLSGFGFYILSTPKGIITDREARKIGVGGELICEIW
ncbi:MAG: small subunit ribosomal protein S8 [Candidatus Berkelbacteria bacterium Athens1014_28]|uniref:Small ribosomal subunit protein uS8 n=1 Tax=Candidatus Berkelbacteria bacterium Athens1014_28 TaxID=2017145 RepID=A0A554LQZ7_9BACT|nr:MAG: small subunit ribosomal protein S8 [Candidatus Berkelbacteria bacterium Athens1014_28]